MIRSSTSDSVLVIEPSRGFVRLNLEEVWAYRDLLYFLAWRDVKVRYKQTALGVAWAVIQPIMTMLVFSVFFGRFAKMPSDGIPYPVFAYTALLPWQLFAAALTESSNSLVGSQNLITKVYFPRLIVPMAAVLGALVDFTISFMVLLGLMLYYHITPSAAIVWLPAFILLAIVTAFGVGLWLSSLNVRYRDVRYTIPFLTQFWMFATPVAYPSSIVPDNLRVIFGLNPMVGVVEGFRWALLNGHNVPLPILASSVCAVIVVVLGGLMYFRRTESVFADLV